MEKLHFHSKQFHVFLVVLQFFALPLFSSAYSPRVKYFINCGSNSNVTVGDQIFVGDIDSDSPLVIVGQSEAIYDNNPLPDTSPLYRTARIYKKQSHVEFNVTKKGTYMLRLHFFAFGSQKINLSHAVFDVSTSNFLLLTKISVPSNFPMIKEFFLTINVGKLKVNFSSSSFAFVNAMEVFVLPSNFIVHDNTTAVPPVTSENGYYYGLLSEALQTVHRINVGGPEVKAANDSLWRHWKQDDAYVFSANSNKSCSFYNGTLDNPPDGKGIGEIAPDVIYRTCKEVTGNTGDSNLPNITWRFNVRMNTRHLVRVHFCNIVGAFLDFNLHIYSNFALSVENFKYPVFLDLVVDSDDSGYIETSVGPSPDYIKKMAYVNGFEVMEFVMKSSLPIPPKGQHKKSLFPVIGSVGVVSILIFLLLFGWRWRGRSHQSWIADRNGTTSSVPDLNLQLNISLAEILAATNNFNRKFLIGEGGFGKVYKGTLQNGKKVAVKRSNSGHGQGVPEFQTEIMILSQIRHRHLVSLTGYCTEGAEMILVYEFMEKGTLRDHLYSRKDNAKTPFRQSVLTWKQRLEICIGIAKGLHYLHTCMDGGIIHRDVKSTNILLDEDYVAKVADFGLSQSGHPADPDVFSMGIKGSFGYLDPESFRTLQLTHKSDVYSFGVVLLEVLCARPPIINSSQREEINLAEWGLFWQKKGELDKIIDPFLVGHIKPSSLRKFGETIENCLKPEGADRPTMLDVYWDLLYALLLQQTELHREPHEDSTTDASLNTVFPAVQMSPFTSFPDRECNVSLRSNDGSETDTRSLLMESSASAS